MSESGVNADDLPTVLDAAQVARLLQLNLDYVRKLSRQGHLPAHRIGPDGRVFRYMKDEILDWLRSQPVAPEPSPTPLDEPSPEPTSESPEETT